MQILSIQQLREAPAADLYLCTDTSNGWSTATLLKSDVESFLLHSGVKGRVDAYRKIDPHAVTLSAGVFAMCNNAAALLQAEGWIWSPENSAWMKPAPIECVPVSVALHQHTHDPKTPSTWPKWEHAAEGGRCLLCFSENVNVTPDPEGVPRCASCWEHLNPCARCGTVSTRPGGEHYCHKPSNPEMEGGKNDH